MTSMTPRSLKELEIEQRYREGEQKRLNDQRERDRERSRKESEKSTERLLLSGQYAARFHRAQRDLVLMEINKLCRDPGYEVPALGSGATREQRAARNALADRVYDRVRFERHLKEAVHQRYPIAYNYASEQANQATLEAASVLARMLAAKGYVVSFFEEHGVRILTTYDDARCELYRLTHLDQSLFSDERREHLKDHMVRLDALMGA